VLLLMPSVLPIGAADATNPGAVAIGFNAQASNPGTAVVAHIAASGADAQATATIANQIMLRSEPRVEQCLHPAGPGPRRFLRGVRQSEWRRTATGHG
jgi:hypothetical protein